MASIFALLLSRARSLWVLRDGAVAWDRVEKWAIASVVVLYVASISRFWWPTPDSALYLMLSDNLLAGEGYTLWGQPHIHVPPGFPLMLAALKWLGLGSICCLNACMVAMALATIWLCYKVLLEQTSRELALLAALAFACSRTIHFESVRILSDVPFMLMVWAGIFCYLRGLARGKLWLEAGTLMLVASCGVRVAGVPLAMAAAVGLVLQADPAHRRRAAINAAILFGALAAVAAVAAAYYWWQLAPGNQNLPNYGDSMAAVCDRSAWQWLSLPMRNLSRTSPFLLELLHGQRHEILGSWTTIFWIPILVGMAIHVTRRHWLPLCVVAGYCGAVLLQRYMIVRYLLPVAPLLILYFCEGVAWVATRLVTLRQRGPQVAMICASLLLLLHLPRTVGFVVYMQFPRLTALANQRDTLHRMCDYLRCAARPGQRFLSSEQSRVFSYLSQVPSIPLRLERSSAYRKDDFDAWVREGVAFAIVVRHGRDSRVVSAMTCRFIRQEGLKKVFENADYRIYRVCPDAKQARSKTTKTSRRLANNRSSPRANGVMSARRLSAQPSATSLR